MKKISTIKKGLAIKAAFLILIGSILLLPPILSYGQSGGMGIEVSGRVTGMSDGFIEVDRIKYRLAKELSVYDMEDNLLPAVSLISAEEVKLEVTNGTVEKIYILIQAE